MPKRGTRARKCVKSKVSANHNDRCVKYLPKEKCKRFTTKTPSGAKRCIKYVEDKGAGMGSDSYITSSSSSSSYEKPIKKVRFRGSAAQKQAAKRSPWLAFVKKYWNDNPNLSYKEALKNAAKHY